MISSNNPEKKQTESEEIVMYPSTPGNVQVNTGNVPNLYEPQPQSVIIMTAGANINHPMTQQIALISEYRVWSIFNIICCFFIIGIFECIKSRETEDRKRVGDLQGALKASKSTKILNICSTIIGIVIIVIMVILQTTKTVILYSYSIH